MGRCEKCGTPIDVSGEARCPACQHSVTGDPMTAPAGSDPRLPPDDHRRTSNLAVWLGMVVVVALAFVWGLFGS